MIEVRQLTRTYGKQSRKSTAFQALKGVSFAVPVGSTVAIVGKSGSGKSTLMHLMGGLDKPTSGDILIDGTSVVNMRRRAADSFRAKDLGFVFQSFFIEPGETCYQNVVLPLEINNVARSKRKQRVEHALDQVGLTDKLKARAGTLSGGQKQRLAIARAIVHSPRIIMADEPTGNLDSVTGEKIIDLLFGLNRRLECTLIIVTHDPELAARCQYQVEMRDGEVLRFTSSSARGQNPGRRQGGSAAGPVRPSAATARSHAATPAPRPVQRVSGPKAAKVAGNGPRRIIQ